MKIQDLFPIQFPFGRGGLDEKRMNAVSNLEYLRHDSWDKSWELLSYLSYVQCDSIKKVLQVVPLHADHPWIVFHKAMKCPL